MILLLTWYNQFVVVINPASGPGSTPYPDSNYIKAISQLNAFNNVITIGYVRTNYGNQPIVNVTADINTYAGWSSYSAANISMHGIFFDESPAVNVSSSLSFMKNVTDRARLSIPSSTVSQILLLFSFPSQLVTNQGVIPETFDYFTWSSIVHLSPSHHRSYTDYLIIFEESYEHLSTVNLDTLPTSLHNKSSIIVHTVPLNESLIDSLTSRVRSSSHDAPLAQWEDSLCHTMWANCIWQRETSQRIHIWRWDNHGRILRLQSTIMS